MALGCQLVCNGDLHVTHAGMTRSREFDITINPSNSWYSPRQTMSPFDGFARWLRCLWVGMGTGRLVGENLSPLAGVGCATTRSYPNLHLALPQSPYSCLHNSRHETFHFEKKKKSCELDISINFAWNDLNLFLSYSLKNRLVHHNKTLLI